jgi:GntR family transcriptional regulator, transcriptional repressor for pyruvate dehydrogenase complex
VDEKAIPGTARKQKLSEKLAAALRERLLSGVFQPGDKLPTESQLTAEFGVSRTVVREAVAALASDGLVEARQGAGVFVMDHPATAFGALGSEMGSKLSMALNVLEVRMAIEIESAGLAALRRSGAQEAAIEEAFLEFDRLLTAGEPTSSADFAFHRAIAEATGNPFYIEVLEVLGRRTIPRDLVNELAAEIVQTRAYQAQLQSEHRDIMDAISAGDADRARKAMRSHLSRSQDRYRQILREKAAGVGR